MNLLIERMLDKSSNASRLVDKLLVKELVERTICKEDRRKADVVITEKGLAVMESTNGTVSHLINTISVVDKGEAKRLNSVLDQIRNNKK